MKEKPKEKKVKYTKPKVQDLGEAALIYGAICTIPGLAPGSGGCLNGDTATGARCAEGSGAAY